MILWACPRLKCRRGPAFRCKSSPPSFLRRLWAFRFNPSRETSTSVNYLVHLTKQVTMNSSAAISMLLASVLLSACGSNEQEKRKKQVFDESNTILSGALAKVMANGVSLNTDSVMNEFIAAGKDSVELGMQYAQQFKQWVDTELPAAIEKQNAAIDRDRIGKLRIQLTAEIENLKTFDGSSHHSSMEGVQAQLQLFKDWADVARSADRIENDTIAQLGKRLRAEIARVQKRDFPKLRKTCAATLKQKFWVEDIEVSLSGPNANVLTFSGGVFAANKNKQDFQIAFRDNYSRLRFKQTRYKWHTGTDEYTSYDMEPPPDDQLED